MRFHHFTRFQQPAETPIFIEIFYSTPHHPTVTPMGTFVTLLDITIPVAICAEVNGSFWGGLLREGGRTLSTPRAYRPIPPPALSINHARVYYMYACARACLWHAESCTRNYTRAHTHARERYMARAHMRYHLCCVPLCPSWGVCPI